MESGIHGMEFRIHKIRWDPGSILVEPVSLESGIHDSGSIIRDPESTGWDLESKGHLDYFT